ncbi:hypothetical protein [uncultured Algoriphagus sp.]|uniref:hypothetical protein n=1 Tax=uncultured Algoriphagus sp. TaxID=417365 RepID=UPI002599F032|nr:hypothetical protein [uncultured Algoriphagus sp.]
MAKLGVTYQELLDLGFKRFDYKDELFFKEYGYHPFVMDFKLAKRYKMEINSDRDEARLYRAEKRPYSENYTSYMYLTSREQIQHALALFGHCDLAVRLNKQEKEVSNG